MATFENWGDYFWPGQIDDCRRNLLGIHDPQQLEREERKLTFARHLQLDKGAVTVLRTFDMEHLRGIHRHLFQDVYEWAGELRVTDLVRPSSDPNAPGHEFVRPGDIERLAGAVFGQLGDPAALASRPRDEQLAALARIYAGVNVLHPFVEGNGRTQRVFLREVARDAGLRIDWAKIPDQNRVMAEAFTLGYQPVAEALEPCVTLLAEQDQAGPVADRGEPPQQAARIASIRSAMTPKDGLSRGDRPIIVDGPAPGTRSTPELGRDDTRGR
jgi:cell filamentation protein